MLLIVMRKLKYMERKDKEVFMFNDYLDNKIVLDKWQKLGVFCLTIVASGLFGWIYEFFFYYINFGMKKFYWQGGNFLPWINIYAYGAIMIMILVRKFKRKPLLVFLIAFFSTGVLEYFSGYVIYKYFGGLRLWDYNTEIWNFLNIDGFVCFRSVFFFGLSSFILVYLMIPAFIYLARHLKRRTFLIISIGLVSLVLFDEIYNLIIARLFSLPRARNIYSKLGFNYMNYK